LHDISDVFLYAARFLRKKYGEDYWATTGSFALFVLTFLVLRMGLLPYYVFSHCWPVAHAVEEKAALALLLGLVGLHYYWSVAITKIVLRLWTKCPPRKQS